MKATKIIIIAILLTAGLLVGCGDRRTDQMLSHIDTLMSQQPDSALQLLDSLKADKPQWAKSQRMRYDLLHLKAENKAFVPLISDSIAKNLVSYYNTWGNANERMMAHYLLGCVYRDKGDSPRAIDAYFDAIAQADTTSKDCDFRSLSRIYAQMAGIYYEQLLLNKSIKASNNASHYALLSHDTLNYIRELDLSAGAYILLNKHDSADIVLKEVYQLYLNNGYIKDALFSSTKRIYLYVKDLNKLSEAKQLINEFEAKSNLFDRNHELSGARRQYYYYKGLYYEQMNILDSAELYYRKVYRPNMSYVEQDPLYRGLLSVYSKKGQADSIAKYAILFCEANDSSISKKDQDLTAKMAATYNYSLYQKEALENESKANKTRIILITFIFLVILVTIILWKRYQSTKKQKQLEIEDLKAEHVRATDEYSRNLYTIQLLAKSHQQDIVLMKKDNTEYESRITELKKENHRLEVVIKRIEQINGISQYLENTTNFMHTAIVRRLKELENVPLSMIKEEEWTELEKENRKHFPNLLLDLHNAPKTTKQKIRVCLLVILKVPDSCIANWMNLKPSRISNIKSELNGMLFGDNSARTLCNNLRQKYNIISSEN